jgi:hypothetical protein
MRARTRNSERKQRQEHVQARSLARCAHTPESQAAQISDQHKHFNRPWHRPLLRLHNAGMMAWTRLYVSLYALMQVGDVDRDHGECIRAECDHHTPRPVLIVDSAHPGSDAFAIAASAFAASSMALASLPAYSELAARCMRHARMMYNNGGRMRECYCTSLPACAKTYKAEQWEQFMFYCAAWLYRSTGEETFKKVMLNLFAHPWVVAWRCLFDVPFCSRQYVLWTRSVVCLMIAWLLHSGSTGMAGTVQTEGMVA